MAKLTGIEKVKVAFEMMSMKLNYATVSINNLNRVLDNKKENN